MEEEKQNKFKTYKIVMIVAISMFITFMVTSLSLYTYFVKNPLVITSKASKETTEISSKLARYREVIDKYYLGEIDEDDLIEGAIKGYVEGLGDPYTEYISKEDMEDYLSDTMGNFVGIGIFNIVC